MELYQLAVICSQYCKLLCRIYSQQVYSSLIALLLPRGLWVRVFFWGDRCAGLVYGQGAHRRRRVERSFFWGGILSGAEWGGRCFFGGILSGRGVGRAERKHQAFWQKESTDMGHRGRRRKRSSRVAGAIWVGILSRQEYTDETEPFYLLFLTFTCTSKLNLATRVKPTISHIKIKIIKNIN